MLTAVDVRSARIKKKESRGSCCSLLHDNSVTCNRGQAHWRVYRGMLTAHATFTKLTYTAWVQRGSNSHADAQLEHGSCELQAHCTGA